MTTLATTALPPQALAIRPDSALEWWFVQGRFTIAGEDGAHDFMASMFRYGGGRSDRPDGYMLLTTLATPGAAAHVAACQVSRTLVPQFLDAADRLAAGDGERSAVLAMLTDEIRTNGPLAPVALEPAPVDIQTAPFRLRWGAFAIAEQPEALTFSLPLPGGAGTLSAELEPLAEWLEAPALGGDNGVGAFAYHSCPRLRLRGQLDGRPVSGEAWLDHQFGGHGWLRRQDGGRGLLGWNWLGASLDDGRQFLVMEHRDPSDGTALSGFAVCFQPRCAPRISDVVQMTERRLWRSRQTMIDYPVEIEVELPEFGAHLHFRPSTDDQEVPVFGMVPAIWEGAGTISGFIEGAAVSGHGRLELFGYGLELTADDYQARWMERIDNTLKGFFPPRAELADIERYLGAARWCYDTPALNEMVFEPMWALLERGGKRWRPLFGLLLLEALGHDVAPFEELMTVVPELIHNASLVIDDIEDGSPIRRGGDAVHRRFGIPTAINAANTLYYLPMLVVGSHPKLNERQRERIYRLMIDLMVRAHFGQAQDLYWSQLSGPERDALTADPTLKAKVLQAYAFKSAAVVRGVAEIACIIAEADDAMTEALKSFAESWGVAFQIIDDVNNFSEAPAFGKVTGEDLLDGKVTVVLLTAIEIMPADLVRRLHRFLARPASDRSDAEFKALTAVIRESEVLAACRAEAKAMAEAAWNGVRDRLPPSRAKVMIRGLVDRLVHSFEG